MNNFHSSTAPYPSSNLAKTKFHDTSHPSRSPDLHFSLRSDHHSDLRRMHVIHPIVRRQLHKPRQPAPRRIPTTSKTALSRNRHRLDQRPGPEFVRAPIERIQRAHPADRVLAAEDQRVSRQAVHQYVQPACRRQHRACDTLLHVAHWSACDT